MRDTPVPALLIQLIRKRIYSMLYPRELSNAGTIILVHLFSMLAVVAVTQVLRGDLAVGWPIR